MNSTRSLEIKTIESPKVLPDRVNFKDFEVLFSGLIFKQKYQFEMDISQTAFLSPSYGLFETPATGYLAVIFLNKNYNL